MDDYARGYNAGYRAGLRHKDGKATPPIVATKPPAVHGSYRPAPEDIYAFMVRYCPSRGGYMFEGARPAFERGEYHDNEIAELLLRGWIKPHPDPNKGWVPVLNVEAVP